MLASLPDGIEFYHPERKLVVSSINSSFIRDAHENYYYSGEMHDFWEMVFCAEGNITVSEDARAYEMSEGQVIFHKPMEFHALRTKKDKSAKLVIMSFDCDKDSLIDGLGSGVFHLDMELKEQLMHVYKRVQEVFDCTTIPIVKGAGSAVEEPGVMLQLEMFLLSVLSDVHPDKTQSGSRSARNYREILKVMKNTVDENLSVDELAERCFLSTSNLKKTFKLYAGCGVKEHYNRLRIIRACSLMKDGMSVYETSEKMNFSSPNYFISVFKKEMGITPAKYVQKAKW